MTGGAISASTAGERAARVREWLATEPSIEHIQEVFRELSHRDKGAARALREKLDDARRLKAQEAMASDWAAKARGLLEQARLNIADAMAWQRDAAKAGAALSREPLAGLKQQLAERVRVIEDLQHRVQVQREAAVLLAQRIEVLSTKAWQDAQQAREALEADVALWQTQVGDMAGDAHWASVDPKFPPQLETSRSQLLAVWEAFRAALDQVVLAATDPSAELPPVLIWAEAIRAQRGLSEGAGASPGESAKPAKYRVDPEVRAQARRAVREALQKLEEEVAQGHGKGSSNAALALRNALKQHGRQIDEALESQAHAALSAAGELGDWQRWRADQLREELVLQAEGLLHRPEGQQLGGRKMQDLLRGLREQWKQTDQGGLPNHALWKRFDEACNQAHRVVEAWLEKHKLETQANKVQRQALIDDLRQWSEAQQAAAHAPTDWKAVQRQLHQFSERWREAGHLGEKAFAELQSRWKDTLNQAQAPLVQAQKASLSRRQALIEEAAQLGAAPVLRIDAIKVLQQHWQHEAQQVPLERKQEQKLWDAFRKPLDEAFQRKSAEREKMAAATSERDRAVLEAAKALEAANASADAQHIRAAMLALEQALRGQAEAAQGASPLSAASAPAVPKPEAATESATETAAETATETAAETASPTAPDTVAEPARPAPKPVIAVRGDDRPGQKRTEAPAPGRGAKPGDRRRPERPEGGRRTETSGHRPEAPGRRDGASGRRDEAGPRSGARGEPREERGPRLGDFAFRAQRDAFDHAQLALKKLSAQAHGETLTRLLSAWAQRDAALLPGLQELGGRVSAAVRTSWAQALAQSPRGDDAQPLLRLEMAADVPTPADQLEARRLLQLQMLTRRNDPSPQQTWGLDVARVLGSAHQDASARRLQGVLKQLLRQ